MKKILLVLAGLAFLLLLSLGLVAACVVRTGHHFSFGFNLHEKASRTETHAIDIAAGKVFAVDLAAGTVRVKASADGAPSLSATITAFGSTQEEANQALARAKLDIASTADGLRVRLLNEPKEESILGKLTGGHSATADLEIRLPPGVRLDLKSSSGDIDAEGPFANAKLHSSYGSVRIQGVEGDLEATSSSGDVTVAGARGKKLVAKSDYGNVHASDCESAETEARSSSGDVKLENVRGDHLRVGSSYGDVELVGVNGEVDAKLSSGDVRLREWTGARASLATSYGGVVVEKASGPLDASSSSGDVSVRDFEGPLVAHSSYGSVQVEGVFSSLKADSSSGDVSAHARAGSRVDGAWKLSSSYGDVKLSVPDGFACDLDAKTAYGQVEVGLPIEVQPGTRKKGSHTVTGKLGGGGGSVELRCTSGDVKVVAGGK